MSRQRPQWWRLVSVGLGSVLGVWTLVIAGAYVVDGTSRGGWTTREAPGFAFGTLILAAYGALILLAAISRSTEIRSGLLLGGSVSVFIVGLFAGGNLDYIGGLLGLPALLGVLAAAFALIESPQWRLAGVYWAISSVAGVALVLLSYMIAWRVV